MRARGRLGFEALRHRPASTRQGFASLARETLRIRAYIAQRFGTSAQVNEDEARKYYEEHPAEFTRDGVRCHSRKRNSRPANGHPPIDYARPSINGSAICGCDPRSSLSERTRQSATPR